MAKAVQMKVGEQTFLVETDETVKVPEVTVVVPAEEDADATPRRPGTAREIVSRKDIEQNFADVKQVIISCCNSLYDAVNKIPSPEKFSIEFGVKLAGETGIPMLTKASGEANFKITVEWKKA